MERNGRRGLDPITVPPVTQTAGLVAEAADIGPVALIDTDPQGGPAGWWSAREAVTPAWIDRRPHGLPAAVTAARKAG
jgi:hypothetical protein